MAEFVKAPVIILRADGGAQIGLGHAMRALALAHILSGVCQVALATRMMPDVLKERYRACGAEVVDLSSVEVIHEPEFICQQVPDASIIIMDGYGFNAEYQSMMGSAGMRVVVVDDMGGDNFSADMIINHSPGVQSQDYRVLDQTHLCLGLDYAILQPVFINQGSAKEESSSGHVFLNMGGADPQNMTAMVLEALKHVPVISRIDVVVGGVNQHFDKLAKMADQNFGLIRLHHDLTPEQMARLMRSADVGVCPSSTVAIEACACTLPLIVGWLVDNQYSIYRGLVKRELALGVDDLNHFDEALFVDQVTSLMSDNMLSAHIRNKQISTFSGSSAINLRRCILGCN
ncbi:MAG: UDP-2,4-diacetamido-2,4,6-trideoxy-beta-L-altropyranose hydrolase [Desulfobulbaceae bacterium]|nr:UDP-2,4-diacetamido-2,4,6-trideoxy-beta-L-altropyranose hydrolase [Desulfobulbaceae bacterium]